MHILFRQLQDWDGGVVEMESGTGRDVGAVEADCHCLCLWLLTNLNRETEDRLVWAIGLRLSFLSSA